MEQEAKRTVLDVLDELDERVMKSDDARTYAIFVMGHALGLAARAGWTVAQLKRMGLVGRAPDTGFHGDDDGCS